MSKPHNGESRTDTVPLDDQEAVNEVLSQSVLGLWDVVNNLTRVRPTRRERYRITIFGSARAKPGTAPYDSVRSLACGLSEMGCDIITGGGPGLMQAANEGAVMCGLTAKDQSVGIRVSLDFEQETNPFARQVYTHRTFFSRLHHFVWISDAFVVVPGGIGTMLELSMIWQLLQVRKLYDTPLILMGGMWKEFVQWAEKNMISSEINFADPKEIEIPRCVASVDEAVAIIREHKARWEKEHKSHTP